MRVSSLSHCCPPSGEDAELHQEQEVQTEGAVLPSAGGKFLAA